MQRVEHQLEGKPLIAVLPFESRSADPAHAHFCDALAGDISDALSRVTSLLVVARASTAGYRGKRIDVRQVGRELGAAFVLEGSVHRVGEQLRISTQLSDAGRGVHLWAEQYVCTAPELFDIEELIIRAIAASTETQIELAGRHRGTAAALAVQDLVARGKSLLYHETPESFAEAAALAEQALAIEPRDPAAHLLRAEAFVNRLAARMIEIDAAQVAHALELSQAALRLAPSQEWAHLCLARAYVEAEQIDAAIVEAELALGINPSLSNAVARLGECYALQGRSADALEACALALKLNPRSPTNYWRHFCIALAHFSAGADEAALLEASRVRSRRPDFLRAAALTAACAAALGRSAEAQEAAAQCRARYPDLCARAAAPRLMPRFTRGADRARLIDLLIQAGVPE